MRSRQQFCDVIVLSSRASTSLADKPLSDVRTAVDKGLPTRVHRVALLGPYHSRNLGDTAIQIAVKQSLLMRRPELQIVGVSIDPADTTRSLGIPAFPLSGCGPDTLHTDGVDINSEAFRSHEGVKGFGWRLRALPRIAVFAGSFDLLVVSGGGQLDDHWGGAWGHPFLLLAWVVLARLRGARVAVAGIGLDRLSNPLSRFFALSALRLAHFRSFRDAGTLAELQRMGLRAPSKVCPDLAFGLDKKPLSSSDNATPEPFAVVNPVSERTWAGSGDVRQENYLQQLVTACAWLSQQGLRLRIVCSQAAMDGATAKRLAKTLLDQHAVRTEICNAPTVGDYLAQVQGARLVIASRLHGAILSLIAGAPVVALAPLRKVTQLMGDVGLAAYCVDLQNVTAADLVPRIAAALQNEPQLRAQVQDHTENFYRVLATVFDDIAAMA